MNTTLAFIAAHLADYSIRLMCRVLGVSRSWFHAWPAQPLTGRRERAGGMR